MRLAVWKTRWWKSIFRASGIAKNRTSLATECLKGSDAKSSLFRAKLASFAYVKAGDDLSVYDREITVGKAKGMLEIVF